MQGVAGHGKGHIHGTLLHPFLGARPKKHSLISTPRMRVRRLQSIAALTCLRGIGLSFAAPHSPTLAMGARKRCMQWSSQPNCCNNRLRIFPVLQERIFSRCILISLLLAECAAADFERVHLIAIVMGIWTASMRIYMLFVSMGELVLVALYSRTAACTRRRRSILRRPPQLLPLAVATRAVRYLLLTVALLETDIRLGRFGHNVQITSIPSKRPR